MSQEREALIAAHLYIVEAEAGKFTRKCPAISYDDHYSAGALGLMKAAETFDPGRGYAFKTMAGSWVRGEIKHQIRAWARYLHGIPKALAGSIRVDSLNELKPMGLTSDGDTMLETLPASVDVAVEALTGLDAGEIAAAVAGLPRDDAAAVREVILGGLPWKEFGARRGWKPSETERFQRRFKAEIAGRLRASRRVAEMVAGGTVRIDLGNGGAAIVDAIDAERLQAWRWLRDPRGFAYSMQRTGRRRAKVRLHHAVVGEVPEAHRVLVVNHNLLDCRRVNLSIVPAWQAYHQQKARNQTGYKGIRLHAISGKWGAEITVHGEAHYLGLFGSPKAAAMAYDQAARELLGEWAVLNFPAAAA
ncbi:MAG TPA: sigma factor [Armatimonadota bacterium]|jgi:RNA polymerase sigma factor (sigma-70 family)